MAYDYGYGELGNELIKLFGNGAPDFEAAEALIKQGADVNALGKADDENILSEIIGSYRESAYTEECFYCEDEDCDNCEYKHEKSHDAGPAMCEIIRFFLDHGFDVKKCDDCYGAQCLFALVLSTYDRYMIDATKILLDAGAKNRTITPTSTDEFETPWSFMATEGSFQGTCEHNHALANIYKAIDHIFEAHEDGRPYSGIDSYELSVGKKILKVLAERNGEQPIFYPISLPKFRKNNCFNQTLYFVYDDGVLITTQYAWFWTDTILPDVALVDVSEHFKDIVGNTIKSFSFGHRSIVHGTTFYGQPITTMEMDNGHKVRFSINFGEVKDADRAAFLEIN